MPRRSQYALLVDNVSSVTSSKDIEREFAFAGKIRDIMKDSKYRCAIVEYDRAADAQYAWRKMDGFRMDGRQWKVDYATKDDFKFFGWKWFENTPSPSRSRSRSPAATKKDSYYSYKEKESGPYKKDGDNRSPAPDTLDTPYNNDDRRDNSESAE